MRNWTMIALGVLCFAASLGGSAWAGEDPAPIPSEITTPDRVDTRLGPLEFKDGFPLAATGAKVRDELDYLHGVEAFMNSVHGVSLVALRKGFADAGIKDGEFIIYPTLMDSNSLFLTANADTIYFWGNVDLSKGPVVLETPPNVLGIVDDFWFRWVTDFGLAGADKGEGGKYLLVGPGYKGVLPEGGYFVRHSRMNMVTVLFRAFLDNNSPETPVATVKETFKIYSYAPGGYGTGIASYLEGTAPLSAPAKPVTPRFVDGTGMTLNTIPPTDFGHFEMLNELVQTEPAEALDPELAGQFAAIGIVKGKKFAPDARLRSILQKSAAFGNAAARTLGMGELSGEKYRYYAKDSAWWNMLFKGGYTFMNPPPSIKADGTVVQPPNSGARLLHARTSFFYTATGTTPAMCMYLTGVGSQYLIANVDAARQPFDGAKTYKVVLPPNIPAERFWSFTVYDNQSRSMLRTPQKFPRAGSQSYPSPAAEPNSDGSTTVYFAPKAPAGVKRGNWIQTDSSKGWFTMLRLYSPGASFFDKTWRISEIEEVK